MSRNSGGRIQRPPQTRWRTLPNLYPNTVYADHSSLGAWDGTICQAVGMSPAPVKPWALSSHDQVALLLPSQEVDLAFSGPQPTSLSLAEFAAPPLVSLSHGYDHTPSPTGLPS